MKHFLVDTENVGCHWLGMMDEIEDGDQLILFYTVHTPKLAVSDVDRLMQKGRHIDLRMISCKCGTPSALDFQLCTYLGLLVGQAPEDEYYVLTNDKGYDNSIQILADIGCKVYRSNVSMQNPFPECTVTCGEATKEKVECTPVSCKKVQKDKLNKSDKMLKDLKSFLRVSKKSSYYDALVNAFQEADTKTDFLISLRTIYGDSKGTAYARELADTKFFKRA